MQRQLGQLLTLRGFVTRQWGTLNLEEVLVRIFGVHTCVDSCLLMLFAPRVALDDYYPA